MAKNIKSTIILLCLISCSTGFAFSQVQTRTSYELEDLGEDISCYLDLYDNGNYNLDIYDQLLIDFIYAFTISYGTYSVNNNELCLKEKYYGYEMTFQIDENKLIPKHVLKFLKNKIFELYRNYTDQDIDGWFPDMSIEENNRRKYKTQISMPNFLLFGIYSFGMNMKLKLSIQYGNVYNLKYDDILLSEGTWSVDGNELELKDKYLDISFYLYFEDSLAKKLVIQNYYMEGVFIKN